MQSGSGPIEDCRRGERSAGKSDPIDALAVARAALREGPETLPAAHLDEAALELKLLLDHREDIVKARSADQQRLRWHLHDLWPELQLPAGCLDRPAWLDRLNRKLARAEQSARVRVARELVVEIRRRSRRAKELEAEIASLTEGRAPELLELEGCGVLTAAKLIAETAGARRLGSDAKFARLAGVAPVPASSGTRTRYRLDRGGNRQLNCACTGSPSARGASIRRRGSSSSESRPRESPGAKPCAASNAHLARRVWQLLIDSEIDLSTSNPVDPQRGSLAPHTAAVA